MFPAICRGRALKSYGLAAVTLLSACASTGPGTPASFATPGMMPARVPAAAPRVPAAARRVPVTAPRVSAAVPKASVRKPRPVAPAHPLLPGTARPWNRR